MYVKKIRSSKLHTFVQIHKVDNKTKINDDTPGADENAQQEFPNTIDKEMCYVLDSAVKDILENLEDALMRYKLRDTNDW